MAWNLPQTGRNATVFSNHGDPNNLSNVTEVQNNSLLRNQTESGESDVFLPWDNPGNLITFQTSRSIVNVVDYYIFPCIFLVGVSTNLINCVVFQRQVSDVQ